MDNNNRKKVGQKERNHWESSPREVCVQWETARQLFKSSPLSAAQKATQVCNTELWFQFMWYLKWILTLVKKKTPHEIKSILDPSLPLKCYWSITINIIPLVLYYWVFKGRWITWDLFTRDEFKRQLLFIRAEIMCLECLSFYLTPAFFPAHNFLQKKIQ